MTTISRDLPQVLKIRELEAENAKLRAQISEAYEAGRISACNAGKPGCPRVAALEAECAPFLKDGETPAKCIARWRSEAVAVLELLRQERVRSEKAEAELAARDAECARLREAIKGAVDGEVCMTSHRDDAPDGDGSTDYFYVAANVPADWAGSEVYIIRKEPKP